MKLIRDSLGIDDDLRLPASTELRTFKNSFDKADMASVTRLKKYIRENARDRGIRDAQSVMTRSNPRHNTNLL
ncbi:MAG: hypothetical protein LBD85_02720 [Oscillospiraceae bacterium]|nr:hypothetical protein [Oscillospiraceae bacterium]